MKGEFPAEHAYPRQAGLGQAVASRLCLVVVMLGYWIASATAQQSTQGVVGAEQSGQPVAVQQVCPPPDARVTAAYKYDPRKPADAQPDPATPVELGEQIALKVDNLGALLSCYDEDPNNPLVLFLSGHPLKNLAAFPPSDPGDGVVYFELRMNDDTRDTWDHLLGSPPLSPISLQASMGPQNGYAIDSAAPLTLRVIPRVWLIVWIAIFVALCAAFFLLARRSNMLRGGGTLASMDSAAGPYSLAKTQAAWWFFVILAAYLLIGLITGDFSTSINGTALALLGIGAATAVGSAVIDASKDNPQNAAAQDAARRQAGLEIDQLENEIPALQAQRDAPAATAADKAKAAQEFAEKQARLAALKSSRDKLVQTSEGFVKDIISDANGASFHRFQVVAWTVVLSIVFVREVYLNLAMPEFDATLLGLQGLSSATYLGLKTQESTIPANAGGPTR